METEKYSFTKEELRELCWTFYQESFNYVYLDGIRNDMEESFNLFFEDHFQNLTYSVI